MSVSITGDERICLSLEPLSPGLTDYASPSSTVAGTQPKYPCFVFGLTSPKQSGLCYVQRSVRTSTQDLERLYSNTTTDRGGLMAFRRSLVVFVGGAFPVYRDLLLNKPFHRFGLARTENIVGKCK